MKAGEHYNAFKLWFFRKHWECWKYSNGGHRKAVSGVSRLRWGCPVHWVTWRGEQCGAQQDFSPHTCWQLSLAVGTACFCVQLAIWGKESILHPCSSAAFNLSTVGMKATKQRLNKKRLLSEGCSLLLGSLQLQLSCALWWKEPSGKIRKRWGQNLYQSTSKERAFPPSESHAKANP